MVYSLFKAFRMDNELMARRAIEHGKELKDRHVIHDVVQSTDSIMNGNSSHSAPEKQIPMTSNAPEHEVAKVCLTSVIHGAVCTFVACVVVVWYSRSESDFSTIFGIARS